MGISIKTKAPTAFTIGYMYKVKNSEELNVQGSYNKVATTGFYRPLTVTYRMNQSIETKKT